MLKETLVLQSARSKTRKTRLYLGDTADKKIITCSNTPQRRQTNANKVTGDREQEQQIYTDEMGGAEVGKITVW